MKKNLIQHLILQVLSILFLITISRISYSAFTDKPGTRPIGIGGAFVGIADDINSLFYNPAGLGRLKRTEVTAMYDQQYIGVGNLNYGYLGLVLPIGDLGGFGFSISQSYYELYQEYIGILSYGTKISNNPLMFIGGNMKGFMKRYVANEYTRVDPYFSTYGYTKTGVGYDISTLLFITKRLSLGVMIENIGEPDMALSAGEKVGVNAKLGIAYKIGKITPVVEVNIKNKKVNGKQDINFLGGVEYKLSDDIVLRGGGNLYNLSVGVSYNIGNPQFDYAFRYPITGLVVYGSHAVQVTYKFGTAKPDQPLTKVIISLPSGVKRMSIAVLDLEANNVPQAITSAISEFLRLEFFKAHRYDVIERKNIDKILKEQIFQQTGCTTSDCAVEIGKILNVHYVIVGSANKLGNEYTIQIRLVDVEKAKVVLADMVECDSEDKLLEATKKLAQRINSQVSIVGKVNRIDGDIVTIDKGSVDKLDTGMMLVVERETITAGVELEEIATVEIEYVDQNISKGKIIKKVKEVKEGDIVNLGFIE